MSWKSTSYIQRERRTRQEIVPLEEYYSLLKPNISQVRTNRFQYNRWQRRICTILVQLFSDVTIVNSVFVSDKVLINNSDSLRIKSLSYSKISAIICVLYSLCLHFFGILKNMSTNVRKFRFLVIFDTGDILHNWSISLLPPIVLYNLIKSEYCRSLEYTPRAQFMLVLLFHVEEKRVKRKKFSCWEQIPCFFFWGGGTFQKKTIQLFKKSNRTYEILEFGPDFINVLYLSRCFPTFFNPVWAQYT